jgi:hypothetical protein
MNEYCKPIKVPMLLAFMTSTGNENHTYFGSTSISINILQDAGECKLKSPWNSFEVAKHWN